MTAPSAKDKRFRAWFGMRNYEFETTDYNTETGEKTRRTDAPSEEAWRVQVLDELRDQGVKVESLAVVFHDRDTDDEGNAKGLHCHFVIEYANGATKSSTLEKTGAEDRNLENVKSKGSAYRYLTHTTDEAMNDGKTRYSVDELHCWVWKSEDEGEGRLEPVTGDALEAWYRKQIQGKTGSNARKPDLQGALADMTEEVKAGRLKPRQDLLELWLHANAGAYMMNAQDITLFLKKNRKGFEEDWRQYIESYKHCKRAEGRNLRLVYISGLGGVGKTKLASDLADLIAKRKYKMADQRDRGDYVYEASVGENGTFDPLGKYTTEPICVLDDLNPSRMKSPETFLRLFETNKCPQVSSRNSDVFFFSDYAFLTKAIHVETWVKKLCKDEEDDLNIKQQVMRRFRLYIDLRDDRVFVYKLVRERVKGGGHQFRFKGVDLDEKEFLPDTGGYKFNNARYIELLELRRDRGLKKDEAMALERLERKREKLMDRFLKLIDPDL